MNDERFWDEISRATEATVGMGPENRVCAEAVVDSNMMLIATACALNAVGNTLSWKYPAYRWTPKTVALHRTYLKMRRSAQRSRNRVDANLRSTEH